MSTDTSKSEELIKLILEINDSLVDLPYLEALPEEQLMELYLDVKIIYSRHGKYFDSQKGFEKLKAKLNLRNIDDA